jgi:hypothetical protein
MTSGDHQGVVKAPAAHRIGRVEQTSPLNREHAKRVQLRKTLRTHDS